MACRRRVDEVDNIRRTHVVKGKLEAGSFEMHWQCVIVPRILAARRLRESEMNNIEIIVCLVLLFMAVPDLCRKLGRPALVFSAFVVFGFLLRPLANPQVRTMLEEA